MHRKFVTVSSIVSSVQSFQCITNETTLIAELATWLVGSPIVVDDDDLAITNDQSATLIHSDCLLNIIIENAQDNLDVLLPTLQFVEVSNLKSE